MKKILLLVFSFIALTPYITRANSFTMHDTVTMTVDSGANVYDYVVNTSNNPVTLKWHVIATTFPADWRTSTALGICDNSVCYYNRGDTGLWNANTNTGAQYTSAPYNANDSGDFHMVLDLSAATSYGTYYLTVALDDPATFSSQSATFIITKLAPASVPTTLANTVSKATLYPNPASQQVSVAFSLQQTSSVQLSVYDAVGHLVYSVPAQNMSAGTQQLTIPTGKLAEGMYNVKIQTANGTVTQRLSVIK